MFEEYLADAKAFYEMANEEMHQNNVLLAKRFYRAAIFHSLGAIEAYVNYIASGFQVTNEILLPQEIAFLNDIEIVFDPRKGQISKKKRYYSIEDKVKFLLKKYPGKPSFNLGSDIRWNHFREIKNLRDKLMHPREFDDETPIEQYKGTLERGLKSIIEIMNIISQKVYRKSLRRRVLDLMPE